MKRTPTGVQLSCNHVNIIGRELNWTRKDCPQMKTVGYDELMRKIYSEIIVIIYCRD